MVKKTLFDVSLNQRHVFLLHADSQSERNRECNETQAIMMEWSKQAGDHHDHDRLSQSTSAVHRWRSSEVTSSSLSSSLRICPVCLSVRLSVPASQSAEPVAYAIKQLCPYQPSVINAICSSSPPSSISLPLP